AAVDGVYVVDPKNDYEVKLFTTTDSSATSPEDFSLGMAMDNQWLIWRNLGVIDSADFLVVNPNPPYNTYQTAPQLRAPCQVAYYFDGPNAKEYLYMADYYGYTLKLWTRDTETSVRDVAVIGEKGFKLEVAYPNPFNPSTLVPFSLTSNADVTIEVFDVAGKKVQTLVNEYKLAGNYNITFDASSLASGNYLIKMTVGNHSEAQKVSLVK
ncbi:MAG: T9SS type A sorting domain-containing protein, partial [FCB group bacterium]|nr:T9SS type A sorting domain-containing protein [FCB group bacterium]